MKFACAARKEWLLAPQINGGRRHRLLQGITFDEIVRRISSDMSIAHKREQPKKYPGCHRIVISLTLDPKTVDLFHNSRCGYRAQYYQSIKAGDYANQWAVQQLISPLKELLNAHPIRTCQWDWVEKSLTDSGAKLWVHQGRWIRDKKLTDRNLCVKRWMEPINFDDQEIKDELEKKQLFSRLTPAHEYRVVIKGGWLHPTGKIPEQLLKPRRSRDLHILGFT